MFIPERVVICDKARLTGARYRQVSGFEDAFGRPVRLLPHKVMQGLAGEDAVVERSAFNDIVTGLQERGYTVYGTVNEKGAGIFRPLSDAGELSLRCTGGTMPPKYLWYPPFETLFTYDRQTGEFHTDIEQTRHAVFGIRPCDVHALLALDEVFLGGEYRDPYYRARRVDLPLVVFNCVESGDTCFCSSMGTGPGLDHDYDLLITDLGSIQRGGGRALSPGGGEQPGRRIGAGAAGRSGAG